MDHFVVIDDQVINGTYEVKEIDTLLYNIFLMVGDTNWGIKFNNHIKLYKFKLVSADCNKVIDGDKDKDYSLNNDPNRPKIFLDANGVTVKCPEANVGDKATIKGKNICN